MHVAHVEDDKPEPDWRVDRYSQHFACDRCGRSFEPLNPHHFSFNSPLGWCPRLRGTRRSARRHPCPAHPRSRSCSLRDGALAAWPDLDEKRSFLRFAEALARHDGFSLDTPSSELTAGRSSTPSCMARGEAGSTWSRRAKTSELRSRGRAASSTRACSPPSTRLRAVSPAYRQRLDHLVSEVACSDLSAARACATMPPPVASLSAKTALP